MGFYVNSPEEKKETFLSREAKLISIDEFKDYKYPLEDHVPICLVDNNRFTAAGVAFNSRERDAFVLPSDQRLKLFYLLPIEKLHGVCEDGVFKILDIKK